MSPLFVLGLGALAVALLLLTLVVLPSGHSRIPLSRLDPTVVVPAASPLAGAGAAAGAAVEKALARRGRIAAGQAALDRAGVATSLPDFVLTVGLVTVTATAVGVLLGGPLAALLLLAVPLGARLLVRVKAGRRQAAFADQLDDSLQLMASSLRAGHSLLRAVDAVSQDADAPTSDEFARIVNETRVGRDLNDAMDEVAERMGSDDFTWVAQAVAIHREVGGNLAEVLDAVGHTIRERNAIRRQVKALSAEGKLSAAVLMCLPVGILGFIYLTNRSYLAAFTESAVGYGMLGVAAVMMVIGGLWLKKTVTIRF
jgi:tight adherence protein B